MRNRNLLSLVPLCFMAFAQAESEVPITDSLQHFDETQWWLADGWENGYPFLSRWEADAVKFGKQGMRISLAPDPKRNSDGSYNFYSGEVRSHDFYSYGCFEIDIKPIRAPGVVTSFFLFSGPYDKPHDGNGMHNEIDIEFLGSNTNMVQMNFWTDDDDYSNSHETLIFLDFDASKDFHRYGIYWSEDSIEWFIDGKSVLKVLDSPFDPIPSISSSRLRMMFNVWATDPKIANWAGKFNHTKKKTYTAVYKNFSYTPLQRCSH
ncbi:family 16 glycosylhydrolase [Vibrio tetraodonis]|uniref:family 16 glycosylhydrolase n=1 Tax=Vibrio tetraodonis TaxID=2231647 RepID=UPI000E0C6DA9|nr:family 16 glycosylhydrolase [Vibrio tetraodonis]